MADDEFGEARTFARDRVIRGGGECDENAGFGFDVLEMESAFCWRHDA